MSSLHIQSWRASVKMKQAGESCQGGDALVAQSCPTLWDPMDCSPPGSSVHGISQARILEWVAISFSRGSSLPRDWICISCISGEFFTNWATREACPSNGLSQIIRKVGLETLWTFWPLCYWNKQEGQTSKPGEPGKGIPKNGTWAMGSGLYLGTESQGKPQVYSTFVKWDERHGLALEGTESKKLSFPWRSHSNFERGKSEELHNSTS